MEKQLYYIKVSTGEILPDQSLDSYELCIEATHEEVNILQELFEQADHAATDTFRRAHIPFLQYHHDGANDHYDNVLVNIYQFIYDHGCDTTKAHIETMGILNSTNK